MSVIDRRARGRLASIQPVAPLIGVIVLALCLITSLDVVTGGVALVIELCLAPIVGLPARTMLLRTLPLAGAGLLAGVSIALYGAASGRALVDVGFVHVTEGSLTAAVATCFRLLAIALPVAWLFAKVDPTDLADGLAQLLRLPARFVLGALAAVRMVSLMRQDWVQLGMARRARGLGDTGRFRRGASMGFTLLVLAIRRATVLATAMESRGFGRRGSRTWARRARFGGPEWALTLACAGIGLVAIAVALVTGQWRA